MGDRLQEGDIKWLMERQVDSYLVWIGLWLVCLLGNAGILATVVSNDTLSVAKLGVIFTVYLGLTIGMVFSLYRLGNILRDHIVLARQIQDTALHDYVFRNRGRISRIVIDDEGRIRTLNLWCIYAVHFVVFLLLFYFAHF